MCPMEIWDNFLGYPKTLKRVRSGLCDQISNGKKLVMNLDSRFWLFIPYSNMVKLLPGLDQIIVIGHISLVLGCQLMLMKS